MNGLFGGGVKQGGAQAAVADTAPGCTSKTLIAHFDADGSGTLDDAEKLALKQAIQQRVAEGRDAE